MKPEQLLREYVRVLLSEDDGGVYGDLAITDATMNPYGISFGSGDDLYRVFLKPFVDVVDTAQGKTKELSQKAQTLAKVAFEAIATSLVPVVSDSYKEIFAKEKEHIDKIREEYHDVYASNWDAFRDNDVMCTAFCYDPTAVLGLKLAKQSPRIAIKFISTLSGGTLDSWLEKVKHNFGISDKDEEPKTGLDFKGHGPENAVPMESLVREDAEGSEKKPSLSQVLTSPKLIEKLKQSPVVQKMEQEGRGMVRSTLAQVYKQAQGVLKANSLQALEQATGSKLKGTEKLSQVPQEDRAKLEQATLAGARTSLKAFYIKNLEGQVKKALSSGIPQDSDYVKDYQRVIARVKAL
jgi:hypothetical protein